MVLVFTILACLAAPRDDAARRAGLERALADLRSARSELRSEAQESLAHSLRLADLDLVASAALDARAAGAEFELRLARAIAGDGRLAHERLELAVLLAADVRAPAQALGRSALRETVDAWSGATAAFAAAPQRLADRALARWRLELPAADENAGPFARTGLEQALELLARAAGEGFHAAVHPDAAAHAAVIEAAAPPDASRSYIGTAVELASLLVADHSLTLRYDAEERAWIERGEARDVTPPAISAFLVACVDDLAARPAEADVRHRAARAIAASSWPAGLEWLTWRAFERGDAAALDGVLVAAGRGRVCARAWTSAAQETVLRLVEAYPGTAAVVAQALAGWPVEDARGVPLLARTLERFAGAGARTRWALLVAAERRAPAAAQGASALARSVLAAAADSSPDDLALRLQALRTLAALHGFDAQNGAMPPLDEDGASRLWRAACAADRAAECASAFVAVGLAPPRAHAAPVAERLAIVDWLAARGDVAGVLAELRELAADPALPASADERAVLALRRLRLVADVVPEVGEGRFAAWALAADVLAGAERERLARRWLEHARAGDEPPLLGLVAAARGATSRTAIEALVLLTEAAAARADAARDEALVEALALARGEIAASGPFAAASFDRALRRASLASDHPLHGALRAPAWPRSGASAFPRDLQELDRRP